MQSGSSFDKMLVVTNGWVQCPRCRRNRRLMRVRQDTTGQNIPAYCRDCKTELLVTVSLGKAYYTVNEGESREGRGR